MYSPMSVGTDWARSVAAFFGVGGDDASKGAGRLTGAEVDGAVIVVG